MMFNIKDYDIALIIYAIEAALLGIRVLVKKVLIIKDSYAVAISGLIIPFTINFIANPDTTLIPKIILSVITAFILWLLFYISKFYTIYIIWNADMTSIESGIESVLIENNLSYQKKGNELILKELNMSIGYNKGKYSEYKIYIRSNPKNRQAFDIIDQGIYLLFKDKKTDKISYEGIIFILVAIVLFFINYYKF